MMELIPCGTEVTLMHSDIKGFITGINIRESRVTYEISYWSSGNYQSNWFTTAEFYTATLPTMQVGFTQEKDITQHCPARVLDHNRLMTACNSVIDDNDHYCPHCGKPLILSK